MGNRTNLVDITGTTTNKTRGTFNAANRLTQTITGTLTNTFVYDAAGRLTNHVVGTRNRWHGYDFRSQMRSLTDTNTTAYAYEFDGDGNRRKETIAGTTKKFIYDGPNILMELDNANTIQALYVNGLGIDQPIEKISYIGGASDGRFVYHTDALGSVFAMTDDLQSSVQNYTYEAFGKLRSSTGSGPTGGNRFTYTGREPLGDTQAFYYYRWRVMDPNVGRFTSEDPLGFVDGVNRQNYARLNPVYFIDVFGLSVTCNPLSVSSIPIGFWNVIGAEFVAATPWALFNSGIGTYDVDTPSGGSLGVPFVYVIECHWKRLVTEDITERRRILQWGTYECWDECSGIHWMEERTELTTELRNRRRRRLEYETTEFFSSNPALHSLQCYGHKP